MLLLSVRSHPAVVCMSAVAVGFAPHVLFLFHSTEILTPSRSGAFSAAFMALSAVALLLSYSFIVFFIRISMRSAWSFAFCLSVSLPQ